MSKENTDLGSGSGGRERVDTLTPENWRNSVRTRTSAGILMGARVESTGRGFVGIYGRPPGFGARVEFDTLAEALSWANRDPGGVMLVVRDEGIDVTYHSPPEPAS